MNRKNAVVNGIGGPHSLSLGKTISPLVGLNDIANILDENIRKLLNPDIQ